MSAIDELFIRKTSTSKSSTRVGAHCGIDEFSNNKHNANIHRKADPSGKKEGIFFIIICTTNVVQIIVNKNTLFAWCLTDLT